MPGAPPPPGGYGYVPYPPQQGGYAPAGPRGYLEGGPVSFGDAVKLAFRNFFTYQGRASRSAYWWFVLFTVIVFIAAGILTAALKSFGQVIDVIAYIRPIPGKPVADRPATA